MSALAPISFASAYRQISPAEKSFVDSYVAQVERDAQRVGERISNALYRPVPAEMVEASRGLIEKPLVRAAITERINQIAADQELSPHRVIKELMGIAFSSIGDYMIIGEDGQPYFDFSKCTPEQLAAVASVEIEETQGRMGPNRKFKFKLFDKLGALGTIARYMGLQDADNPHWRAETARPVNAEALPAGVGVDDAADRYARMLG